jgi:hypothetical protein
MSVLFEHAFIIGMLFAIPLIASFIVYIVATSFGVAPYPGVGYGIVCATSSGGVCTLWNVATGSTAPTIPLGMVSLLNSFLIFISLILGIIAAVKLGPVLFESVTGGNE